MKYVFNKTLVLASVFILPLFFSCVSDYMRSSDDKSLFIDVEENEAREMKSEQKEGKDKSEERFALLHVLSPKSDAQVEFRYFAGRNRLSRGCVETLIDPPEPI